MTITRYYLRRITDVLSILSHELAHIESIEDRSTWLLVVLYNGQLVITIISCNMYDMICIHNFTYIPAIYKIFAMVSTTRASAFNLIKPICPMISNRITCYSHTRSHR